MKDYKVGDTVVFVGKAPNYKHVDGRGKWIDLFESLVGKSVEVMREKDKVGDYHVYYREGDAEYWMNEAWLTPQFKAGDRVIIHRPETEEGRIEGPVWMDYDMNCYDGKMFTIRKIMQDGHVVVDSMGFDYHFHPRWLELVEDEPQKFAVGDLVKVTKPTEKKRGEFEWIECGGIGMIDNLVGRVEEVEEVEEFVRTSKTALNGYKISGGNDYWYDPSWLTLIEKVQPQEQKEKIKMSKFKVGDKVRVVEPENRLVGPGFIPGMNVSGIQTISKCIGENRYELCDSYPVKFVYLEEWLEPAPKKRGKFETLCKMAEIFDFGIYVEDYDVMVYIKLHYEDCERRTNTFRLYDSMESAYKNAYKWLLENALEMSESFKEWYNGRD